MPTGFHPDTHFFSAHFELAVELLRFLAVPQFPLVPFTTVRIDKRNLLEARVIVTTYNDHVRLLSPEPWLVSATKVYSGIAEFHSRERLFRPPLARADAGLPHIPGLSRSTHKSSSHSPLVRTTPMIFASRTATQEECQFSSSTGSGGGAQRPPYSSATRAVMTALTESRYAPYRLVTKTSRTY